MVLSAFSTCSLSFAKLSVTDISLLLSVGAVDATPRHPGGQADPARRQAKSNPPAWEYVGRTPTTAGTKGGVMPYGRIFVGTTILLLALVTGGAFAATGGLPLGPSSTMKARDFKGYYDGHKDTFLVTDVSNKAQARACLLYTSPSPRDS